MKYQMDQIEQEKTEITETFISGSLFPIQMSEAIAV